MNAKEQKNQNERERRLWLKEHGICTTCGMRSVAPHRTKCEICLAKNAEYQAKKREEMTDEERFMAYKRQNFKRSERNDQRIKDGICVVCGRPNNTRFQKCVECTLKHREANRRLKIKKMWEMEI